MKNLSETILSKAELNLEEVSYLFGVSEPVFKKRFLKHSDFPRIAIEGRQVKYPKTAVVKWYEENWERCYE